jgi:hypothetical protein
MVKMSLDKYKKFLEELRGLVNTTIEASHEGIEESRQAKTDYSKEFLARSDRNSDRLKELASQLNDHVRSFIEPNLLERLFGSKLILSQWTRWRSMAKGDIARLPVEQRSAAENELRDLDKIHDDVKTALIEMYKLADQGIKAAKESVQSADGDIRELKAEMARRQKMKGQPPAK